MNADQLGQIVNAALEAIEESGMINRLEEFNNAFNNLISDSNETHQQQFNDKRNELRTALKSESFRQFPNTWRTALEELGIYELIGLQMDQRIDYLIENNQLTPVIARDEIKNMTGKINEYQTQFIKIKESFAYLGLGMKKPDSGEGVLSVLMPRDYYQGELARFAEQMENFSKMAGWLSEMVTGKTEIPKIKELSTTEPWVLISMVVGTVIAFLEIVERIQNIRINTHNLNKLGEQAEQLEASPAVRKAIKDDVEKVVEKRLSEIHKWLFDTYKLAGQPRLNEIKDPVEKKLKWLADCLDHGYQIDGDAGDLDEDNDLSEDDKKKYSTVIERIKEMSSIIKYLDAPSKPVLMLTEALKPSEDEKKK